MAFPIITSLGFDKTGSLLTLRDDSVYGGANPSLGQIQLIRLTLSQLDEVEIFKQDFTTLQDKTDKVNHVPFTVSSISLGQDVLDGFLPFEDGVLNVDYYVAVGSAVTATITKGEISINMTGNSVDYKIYDSIIVGSSVYNIDKTRTTLSNLVLVEDILEDATSFLPAYRSNLKVLNTTQISYKLSKQASRYALCCDVNCKDLELLGLKEFAEIAFTEKDYSTASKLLSNGCSCSDDSQIILQSPPSPLPLP